MLLFFVLGPKPEKTEGLDSDGLLLPVSRLLNNPETAPTHLFEDLAKSGYRPGKQYIIVITMLKTYTYTS